MEQVGTSGNGPKTNSWRDHRLFFIGDYMTFPPLAMKLRPTWGNYQTELWVSTPLDKLPREGDGGHNVFGRSQGRRMHLCLTPPHGSKIKGSSMAYLAWVYGPFVDLRRMAPSSPSLAKPGPVADDFGGATPGATLPNASGPPESCELGAGDGEVQLLSWGWEVGLCLGAEGVRLGVCMVWCFGVGLGPGLDWLVWMLAWVRFGLG